MSGEQAEVEKEKRFFGLLTSCLVWPTCAHFIIGLMNYGVVKAWITKFVSDRLSKDKYKFYTKSYCSLKEYNIGCIHWRNESRCGQCSLWIFGLLNMYPTDRKKDKLKLMKTIQTIHNYKTYVCHWPWWWAWKLLLTRQGSPLLSDHPR